MANKINTEPEKTQIYTPLSRYAQLGLDDYALYGKLKNYLLSKEQLRSNGFPEESPENPGRAIFKDQKVEKGSTKRHCCRCTSSFHVYPDGRYDAESACRYHLKKKVPSYARFPCCNGGYLSEGCMTGDYHVTQESSFDDFEFVKTKHKNIFITELACTVFALDCDMVYTTAGMEVAKVVVVGLSGDVVYESYVLPQSPILDYNTLYSGITEKDLAGICVTLGDVQAYLLKLLNEDSILVGHGLENDLKALRLIHDKVVDTSVVFPHQRNKHQKKSLKDLALEFLNKTIQQSRDGRDCIEGARTCLDLMLFKISEDVRERPLIVQDENRNSLLQNLSKQSHKSSHYLQRPQPTQFTPNKTKYSERFPLPRNSNDPSCFNKVCTNKHHSGNSTPKIYMTYNYDEKMFVNVLL